MEANQALVGVVLTTPNYNRVEIKQYGDKLYQVAKDYWFSIKTDHKVIDAILAVAGTSSRVRIYCGDADTGKDWGERYDVTGTIGRSMGPVKVPLLIHNSRSIGGLAISTDCIVKMRHNGKNGIVLYKHPTYSHGEYTIGPNTDAKAASEGYLFQVQRDGERVYGCKTEKQALAEVAFMTT